MSGRQQLAPAGRRVHWMELFFDLVLVAYIGQIARGMHGNPDWTDALVFVVLFAAAWWAWVNATLTMNLFGAQVTPSIWLAVTVAMVAIGIMAAAVPDALGDRAAAFAVGNALIRAIWMLPWFLKRRIIGVPLWRPVVYNVLPAALWIASVWVPSPWQFGLWVVAIGIEVVLLRTAGRSSTWIRDHLDVDHLIERVSLLVVIVFGESIISIINALADDWNLLSGITAGLAFAAVAMLAWIFFGYATAAAERGLHGLHARGSISGLRDTVMYLPFPLVAGVVLFAAGSATAVAEAGGALALGAAACLGGGMSLYFAASVAESLRYGAAWRDIVLWGPPGILLPLLLLPASLALRAEGVAAVAAGVIAAMLALTALNTRRMRLRAQHPGFSTTPNRRGEA